MTLEQIVAWFNAERSPALSESEAVTMLAVAHPRTLFVKGLAPGTTLLDLGAGDGGLEVLRQWPPPARPDLRLYAYSLSKGDRFDAYDGFELGNWLSEPPSFPGVEFNAVYSASFIEYIPDVGSVLAWIARRLTPGGRLYLEWPSPFSALLPTNSELAEKGIRLMISHIHDDGVEKVVHDRAKIVGALSGLGFFIEQQGYVSLPFLEDELLAHAKRGMSDAYALQTAYWSKTRWTQYVVAVRK